MPALYREDIKISAIMQPDSIRKIALANLNSMRDRSGTAARAAVRAVQPTSTDKTNFPSAIQMGPLFRMLGQTENGKRAH